MKGQLSRMQDLNQRNVETHLASLGIALALLEHDEMRVKQAIGRYAGLLDLLAPVILDLSKVTSSIRAAQEALRDRWEDGQERRWT